MYQPSVSRCNSASSKERRPGKNNKLQRFNSICSLCRDLQQNVVEQGIPAIRRAAATWYKLCFSKWQGGGCRSIYKSKTSRSTTRRHLSTISLYHRSRLCHEQIGEEEQNLGFIIDRARIRRHTGKIICDADFADDVALMSNNVNQAQKLLTLTGLERAARQIGPHINSSKTKYMFFNQDKGEQKTIGGEVLNKVEDFRYLEAWVNNWSNDINNRIGMAWSALSKLDKIWGSGLKKELKIKFYKVAVETVLLFGPAT
ncbi:hypothetical protein ElyMa_002292600 [Elysia marginata]|uniref:Reverse transcriptase domain-containing protein n=1 Tax=Elysia marginata TaxID=1093978 RepID=A0AAV4G3K1_9GAST|nr:hypothetical protein ElyMa_002292600 [Elysia marginata]